MNDDDFHAWHWAGIAVVAYRCGIAVRRLACGDHTGLNGEAKLVAIEQWCNSAVGFNYSKAIKVEDYVTTLLAGSAASCIYVQDSRCHLKRSLGEVGLELAFLREIWECLQPEADRAAAIILGYLGSYDDGDVEATAMRLWRRAIRILRQPPNYNRLSRLATELLEVKRMSGNELIKFLKQC